MFCVVNEDMGSNNFYGIWTKISFLEHSDVFLSFRKGSANRRMSATCDLILNYLDHLLNKNFLSFIDSHIPRPSRMTLVLRPALESDILDATRPGKCNVLIVDVVKSATVSNDIFHDDSIIDIRYRY